MENLKAAITLNEHAKAQGVVPNLATRTALVNAAAKVRAVAWGTLHPSLCSGARATTAPD